MTVSPGLVGQVTSVTQRVPALPPNLAAACFLRELNRQRRVRRMRRVVIASADAARASAEKGGNRLSAIMVTLTYAEGSNWSSRDVTGYVRRVREWLRRRDIEARYQWVIELTQRGRPHYHLLWWVPRGVRLPKPDASGQWTLGSSRIEAARRAVGYLVKYATKGTDGKLPSGARLFGTGAPEADVRQATHRAGLPMWLSSLTPEDSRWSRTPHVGWVRRETGEILRSPFKLSVFSNADGHVFVTITEVPQS